MAEQQSSHITQNAAVPLISSSSGEETDIALSHTSTLGNLADEIDDLRRQMTEAFLKEESFLSESVIEISRLLDTKIIEYMKLVSIVR
ncbi:aspartyl-phosphate phosphatase Spo0E family protein [Cohnella thailandensis]|uniref:Aspartyl-phosphate phosphatase Spo0E family protein n=2 Tax=Cohnella thailandensis TaxID=557557 RepID=A0A841SVR9_9BACL|nr:aspartyl-phosphate phosphatase Spo0E family protein [Cohnella thailandensis]MBB6633717.1 aspartyl-phosphate phosphatase Spo0E family protein [Cohnella thailandensis]MBP1976505.1 cell division septum initiation protein DivIVA [Cohnella thailandensis]